MTNDKHAWSNISEVWKSGQVALPQVVRWAKYGRREDGKIRMQNSLQHSYSIVLLGMIFIAKIKPYVLLDDAFLIKALHIHDHGEGEIQSDTLYIDKTIEGDLQEYLAFRSSYEQLDPEIFEEFHRAFLLQFALKNPDCFPSDAREIMAELAKHYTVECHAFDAIERWDYVMYAYEQFCEHNNEKILVQTLRHQIPHLDRLADTDLPGFGEVIWTPEVREGFTEFLLIHEGHWLEKKGEK